LQPKKRKKSSSKIGEDEEDQNAQLERKISYLPLEVVDIDFRVPPLVGAQCEDWSKIKTKDGPLYDPAERVETQVLDYLLRKAVPDAVFAEAAREVVEGVAKAGRKRKAQDAGEVEGAVKPKKPRKTKVSNVTEPAAVTSPATENKGEMQQQRAPLKDVGDSTNEKTIGTSKRIPSFITPLYFGSSQFSVASNTSSSRPTSNHVVLDLTLDSDDDDAGGSLLESPLPVVAKQHDDDHERANVALHATSLAMYKGLPAPMSGSNNTWSTTYPVEKVPTLPESRMITADKDIVLRNEIKQPGRQHLTANLARVEVVDLT